MSEKRRINKDHPDYPEYLEKCKILWDKYSAKEDSERNKYPEWRGLDHPASAELKKISLQHNEDLRKLQDEYAYLFTCEKDGG